MANPDRTRKLLIRSALASSATAAVFIGAGNLATLDARVLDSAQQPASEALVQTSAEAAQQPGIQHVAPSLTIVRASGSTQTSSVQAPSTRQMSAPVMVRRPVMQRGRASR